MVKKWTHSKIDLHMRSTLNLDDGGKVSCGKFGDLLEGVKIVTGGASDD